MGGSQPRNQTTTTVTQYPAWLEGPMRDNIAEANRIADQRNEAGYQGYNPQDRIANFNDLQLNALQQARDSVGSWNPLMQRGVDANAQAMSIAQQTANAPYMQANAAYAGPGALVQAQQLKQTNLQPYMSPFQDMVTNNALAKLEDQRQIQQTANADQFLKARAFGGSRQGLVEANTNAAFAKQAADTALNSAQANFLNAQSVAQNDIGRNLQGQLANQQSWNSANQFNAGLAQQANLANANNFLAGRGLGLDAARMLQSGAGLDANLASQYQGLNSNDLNNMLTAGNALQDQDQAYRDFAYQEFLNRQNFPIDNLNLRFAAINNTNYQPGSSSSSPIYRNRAGGFLGGASTGAGIASALSLSNPATAGLALGGGLLGLFG